MSDLSNIPSWLASVAKIAWWVFAALTTGAGLILWLDSRGTTWFPQLLPNLRVTAWLVFILSGTFLFFQSLDRGIGVLKRHQKGKVQRRFSRLSEDQIAYLMRRFERGHRRFEVPVEQGKPRWLEELEDWNYIEIVHPSIYMGGMPMTYYITRAGWRELERFERKSHRRAEQ